LSGADSRETSVLVVVRLCHLNETDPFVREMAQHAIKEFRERNVVRIEDEHERFVGHGECTIDFAGFGARNVEKLEPDGAMLCGQLAESGIARVVEQVCRVRMSEPSARDQRSFEHRQRFPRCARDEDGNRQLWCRRPMRRLRDSDVVDPPEQQPADAVPEGDRQHDKER
jgi:hypothetical protein